MKKLLHQQNCKSAFSLVEVLVAISILLLVVVTPMGIVTNANNSTAFANEQLVAFFLAQEGLELVEKGRNDFYLQHFQNAISVPNPMSRFINQNPLVNCRGRECGVQINNDGTLATAIRCGGTNNNCRLYLTTNNVRSKYVHGGDTPVAGQSLTPYTRKVKMEPITNTTGKLREVKVTSTVTWRTGSLIAGQKVELVTYLTNIYDTN